MRKAVYFDSSAVLSLLKGDKSVLRIIEDAPDFYTGVIPYSELLGAQELLKEKKSKGFDLSMLFNSLKILELGIEDARKAAEIMAKLKNEGKEIFEEEAFCVAQCINRNLVLVTKDRGMGKFKGLVEIEFI